MPVDDWQPACSLEMLRARARLRGVLREFFEEHDYLEVDTPLLSHDIVVDAHLDPLTSVVADETLYLQTSPEAAMKRLLASGSGNIYQITRSFRAGERGSQHNPEFTIVEWYGLGSTFARQLDFTEALVRRTAASLGGRQMKGDRFRVTTYQTAFRKYLDIDPLSATDEQLRQCATSSAVAHTGLPERDELLNQLLADHVEPHLGQAGPEFLIHYPRSQAALARVADDDARVAERFELYLNGMEICNGYGELQDAKELRRRDRSANQRRIARGADRLPGALRMLAAMDEGLPECSGVALGFDRLLMWLTGREHIDDVLPFAVERS